MAVMTALHCSWLCGVCSVVLVCTASTAAVVANKAVESCCNMHTWRRCKWGRLRSGSLWWQPTLSFELPVSPSAPSPSLQARHVMHCQAPNKCIKSLTKEDKEQKDRKCWTCSIQVSKGIWHMQCTLLYLLVCGAGFSLATKVQLLHPTLCYCMQQRLRLYHTITKHQCQCSCWCVSDMGGVSLRDCVPNAIILS